MGWTGNGLYDGDGTQTQHYDFLKWAGCIKSYDEMEDCSFDTKTKIPKDKISLFVKNTPNIIKKMYKAPKETDDAESSPLQWQMLLALFCDNNLMPPDEVLINGLYGTKILMGNDAGDFNSPTARRKVLKNFHNKICKKYNVKFETVTTNTLTHL